MWMSKNKKQISFRVLRPMFYENRGFGLLEILIAATILSASLVTLSATSQITFRLMKVSVERTQAGFLAEEAIEVVRILRDSSWSSHVAPRVSGATHYLNFNTTTNTWTTQTVATPLIYDIFTRTVVFQDVYRRNSDGEIVDQNSPDLKTLDPDTKKITARVLWGAGHNIIIETYITNIFQN